MDKQLLQLDVGGQAPLTVARWGTGERVVLLSHGITANHHEFVFLARELGDECTLLAPDHRGRAASNGVGGPYGFAQHARDLAAVADHVGAERVSLIGHSMGGFVVAAFAKLFGPRVEHLLLVDGGIPLDLPFPEGTPIDDILNAVIGPAMARLEMRWPTSDAYVDFFRAHPSLNDPWLDEYEAYVLADAVEGSDGWRSSVDADAVRADMAANMVDDIGEAIREVAVPSTMLWAGRGMFNEPGGLYGQAKVDREAAELPLVTFSEVDDVNHYTIMLSPHGAAAVAATFRELAARP